MEDICFICEGDEGIGARGCSAILQHYAQNFTVYIPLPLCLCSGHLDDCQLLVMGNGIIHRPKISTVNSIVPAQTFTVFHTVFCCGLLQWENKFIKEKKVVGGTLGVNEQLCV